MKILSTLGETSTEKKKKQFISEKLSAKYLHNLDKYGDQHSK